MPAEITSFDDQLEPGIDIPELWQTGKPYSQLSPRRDMRRAGNLLIRQHPRQHFPGTKTQEDLADMVSTAKRHFDKLRQLGMSIISHRTVINPEPWPEDNFEWDEEDTVAFSASAYAAHLLPLDSVQARPLQAIPRTKVEEFVIRPLRSYVEWGISSKEILLLDDIVIPDQYSWQRSSGIVALHDPGPQMSPTEEVADVTLEEAELELNFHGVGHL